jgi:hypothetical protein
MLLPLFQLIGKAHGHTPELRPGGLSDSFDCYPGPSYNSPGGSFQGGEHVGNP